MVSPHCPLNTLKQSISNCKWLHAHVDVLRRLFHVHKLCVLASECEHFNNHIALQCWSHKYMYVTSGCSTRQPCNWMSRLCNCPALTLPYNIKDEHLCGVRYKAQGTTQKSRHFFCCQLLASCCRQMCKQKISAVSWLHPLLQGFSRHCIMAVKRYIESPIQKLG